MTIKSHRLMATEVLNIKEELKSMKCALEFKYKKCDWRMEHVICVEEGKMIACDRHLLKVKDTSLEDGIYSPDGEDKSDIIKYPRWKSIIPSGKLAEYKISISKELVRNFIKKVSTTMEVKSLKKLDFPFKIFQNNKNISIEYFDEYRQTTCAESIGLVIDGSLTKKLEVNPDLFERIIRDKDSEEVFVIWGSNDKGAKVIPGRCMYVFMPTA